MRSYRLMTAADLPAVLRVQAECYSPMMQEDEATIRSRLQASPDTAWVAEGEGGLCAYLFAYRSTVGKVTPLGGRFETVADGGCLYLHDLAVARGCKGQGVGQALVGLAIQSAEAAGLTHSALISVQGSQGFWRRLGYADCDGLAPAQLANLQTYEGPAYYMVRRLVGA